MQVTMLYFMVSKATETSLLFYIMLLQMGQHFHLIRNFLAKNNGGFIVLNYFTGQDAWNVIPLRWRKIPFSILSNQVPTFLVRIVRFASVPRIVACQWSVICPVELIVCLSVKS